MIGSANEVMTLAAKAARGGGAPPEQANQFGKAALSHMIAGRTEEDLTAALNALPAGPILSLPPVFIAAQEAAADGRADIGVGTEITDALMTSYAESQVFHTIFDPQTRLVRTNINKPTDRSRVARVRLSDDLAGMMQGLAARILVPDSDASRRSGAGAGLTDND